MISKIRFCFSNGIMMIILALVVIPAIVYKSARERQLFAAFLIFTMCMYFLFHLFENGFLALEDVFDDCGVVSVMDEEFGDMSGEEAVSGLSSGDDGADGDVLVMEHEVLHEETFTGVTATDEDNNGALVFIGPKADGAHVKFREF